MPVHGRADNRHGFGRPVPELRLALGGGRVGHMLGGEVDGDLLGRDVEFTAPGAELLDGGSAQAFQDLRKRGVVVGLSGGVDSTVCAALCARALGV